MAGFAQGRFGRRLVFELECRSLDDDAARHAGLDNGGDGSGKRRGLRQAGDDGRRLPRDIAGIGRDFDAGAGQRPPARDGHVVADHAPARGEEIAAQKRRP